MFMQERIDSLVMELSIKEAKWCETEEDFKLKVRLLFKINRGDVSVHKRACLCVHKMVNDRCWRVCRLFV